MLDAIFYFQMRQTSTTAQRNAYLKTNLNFFHVKQGPSIVIYDGLLYMLLVIYDGFTLHNVHNIPAIHNNINKTIYIKFKCVWHLVDAFRMVMNGDVCLFVVCTL